jgi:hypothetical protein
MYVIKFEKIQNNIQSMVLVYMYIWFNFSMKHCKDPRVSYLNRMGNREQK